MKYCSHGALNKALRVQIGGRGLWRFGARDLADFNKRTYLQTEERVRTGSLPIKEDPENQ